MSTSPLSFDPYVVNNLPGPCFLDVGCGYGKWGFLLRNYRSMDYPGELKIAGVDLFQPHIDSLQGKGLYDDLRCCSATELPFDDQTFDSAVCCEVLEHLPRSEGSKLLAELKRVCRRGFMVSTPLFSCYRGGSETLDGFNPYEAHQYCYSAKEFRNLGFTQVVGVGMQMPSWKLSTAMASLSYFFPQRARYGLGCWWSDGLPKTLSVE
jgi:ubiquinone/menaquinone biosynthesis C-methylase UbiE